jgi:hypothetical protein
MTAQAIAETITRKPNSMEPSAKIAGIDQNLSQGQALENRRDGA